jgi:hypothetical protein
VRTDNLHSPLAVGLLAAAAVAAAVLPPTAGQLAQPGARVVSDANIRLATCQKGPNGFTQFCFSQSANSAGETITNFAMSGLVGKTATLVNTATADSIKSVLTGPLGRTATFYYRAYYEADQDSTQITAYFTGPGGLTINYAATEPGGCTGGGCPSAADTAVTQAPDLNLTLTNYSGVSAGATVQPIYTSTRRSVFSSRTTRSAAARAAVDSPDTGGLSYGNGGGGAGSSMTKDRSASAVRSAAALSAPAVQAPASGSAEVADSTPTTKPVTQRTARKAAR